MRVKEYIERPRTGRWIKRMVLAAAVFIMFSYLYSRGISPVQAAVAIVCFRGSFRFLYKIACLLVVAAILFCILSCLVFRFHRHIISGNETNAAYKPLQHLVGQDCPNGRLFWYPIPYEDKDDGIRDGEERKERHIQSSADRGLQGKVGKRFFSDGGAGTPRVSRGNYPHPEGLRYFSRKLCLPGSVYRKAHVV